jgi:sirohydrochlorin ferrochelatase
MRALLIMAHGSPRAGANDDILRVAALLRERQAFPLVEVCYLDCNDPDIAAGVDLCVRGGASDIVAVPYFLHSGKHFLKDIPEILESAAARHPGVRIVMGDYVGHTAPIATVLLDRVRALLHH